MRALPACVRPARGARGRGAAAADSADTGSSLSPPSCAQSIIVENLKTKKSALLQAKKDDIFSLKQTYPTQIPGRSFFSSGSGSVPVPLPNFWSALP